MCARRFVAAQTGLSLFNVSSSTSTRAAAAASSTRYRGGRLPGRGGGQLRAAGVSAAVGEPSDEWPWWWWGVDTDSAVLPSVFHGFNGTFVFSTADEVRAALDPATLAELDAAGALLDDAAASIDCTNNSTGGDDDPWGDQSAWCEILSGRAAPGRVCPPSSSPASPCRRHRAMQ